MKYTEIFKLKEMLEKADIPFEFIEHLSDFKQGFQICYPDTNKIVCSVVEHSFSYGNEKDLLEISGLLSKEEEMNDSVKGFLTAENVFDRIKRDYGERPESLVMSLDDNIGDDDYKPNVGYVIGLNEKKLYSHCMDKLGVFYVDSVHHACVYEHFTDAKIGVHGLYKDGFKEAKNYKIYKAVCQLQECENYVNNEE